VTGERQAACIRGLYFETILRQDISFFERMSNDTALIQDAIGEKV
jgi:ATP-binding cassette, subfamily B (MDR/TAP), member 1